MEIFICVYNDLNNLMFKKTVLPNHKNKIYGGAWSVYDHESINFLKSITPKEEKIDNFLPVYKEWIGQDFSNYPHICFSNGTTETFDKFYFRYLKKRLRIYKGEYFYHQIMARNFMSMLWIDEGPIQKNDVVVMSCPFSDTGELPDNFYDILSECEKWNVPVMLDMAYINISNLKNINLNFNCIKTITTSLSKVFPVEHHRIGIRFEREYFDDTLYAYNQNNYVNLYSVNIGLKFISKFSNNWLLDKYRNLQQQTCNELGVNTSSCVIFGIAKKGKFDEYNRGGESNRLCFSKLWDKRVNL